MNLKEMASNIGVDEGDFIELLEMLVDVSLTDIKNFEAGVNTGNYIDAAMSAHSIKGAAGNLGMTDISTTAAELEKAAKSSDQSQMPEKVDFLKKELSRLSDALKQVRS
ncbi:MAG: Hpt domain-containing protein [Desulfamplus sp.]|nr:Hpt domain-containing protein [Desulfamplus sp.]